MARHDEGRTATVNDRMLKVLAPTLEEAKQWKQRAEKAGMSLSRYLWECASNGLVRSAPTRERERAEELEHRIQVLTQERDEFKERHRWDEKLLRIQESELKALRSPRPSARPAARRRLRPEVLRLLRDQPSMQDRDLYRALGILQTSPEAAQVSQDLELLERGGIVGRTGNGWRLLLRDAGR